MKQNHLYTSEEKLEWFGNGEWVEEPDEAIFEHEGFKCHVLRIAFPERYSKELRMFGGYFCGYICIPNDHPWFEKGHDIASNVHGGVTFCDYMKDDKYWVGFDCAHSYDYCPSLEKNLFEARKTDNSLAELYKRTVEFKKKFADSLIWEKSYKNINFVIEECKSLAKQAKDAMEQNIGKT